MSESLAAAWEAQAANWIAWARAPMHDAYEQFHCDAFLSLVPPPGRVTLDVGCGEGRLARDLARIGHCVVGVDRSPTLSRAAREARSAVVLAAAAALPVADGAADLVVAFMSLQDMDDAAGAVTEIARALEPGGRAVVAVVHPINGAGSFAGRSEPDAPFVVDGSYLASHRYSQEVDRDGLAMRFTSDHHSLDTWSRMLERAGLVVDAIREVGVPDPGNGWARIPLFLHLRLTKLT